MQMMIEEIMNLLPSVLAQFETSNLHLLFIRFLELDNIAFMLFMDVMVYIGEYIKDEIF